MKNILILSEAIYKGQIKIINKGSFINISDIVNDVLKCFNIPCCDVKGDSYIRKAYVKQGRKKPGTNWTSLNKIILEVYNCEKSTTLCTENDSLQWWITTDVIRPRKTIETINFKAVILKVFGCCGYITRIVTQNSNCLTTQNGLNFIR